MHPITQLSTEDLKAYTKFAQLYSIIYNDAINQFTIQRAKRIIKKEGNVNYQIPSNNLIMRSEDGSTLLHLAWNSHSSEITEDLLNFGANFTLKNKCGDTALHCHFNVCSSESKEYKKYQDNPHIGSILSAHIAFANPCNPCDENGFSHFHMACIANNTKAVEYFLENGVDVNQAVNKNGSRYPGYTPLHFAVDRCSIGTTEVLLNYSANKNIKDGNGMTSLHRLLNQKIELLGLTIRSAYWNKHLEDRVQDLDKIVFMLLGNKLLDNVQIVDDTGLSSFHIACMMQDSCIVEGLLKQVEDVNHCVKVDSPVWPGYTAFHFAALCHNMSIVKLLMYKQEARIDVKNAEGIAPFDICVKMGYLEDMHSVISLKPEWSDILFSDNKTTLVNFISTMRDANQQYRLINQQRFKNLFFKVPVVDQPNNFLGSIMNDTNLTLSYDSPLWPGCTPLHLAVIMCNKFREPAGRYYLGEEESTLKQIAELLNSGADVTKQNANRMTPLHLAFRQNKAKVSKLLRKHHHNSANPVDEHNLSHLHIACAENDDNLVMKILSGNNIDVNMIYKGEKDVQSIKPGWTPLNCTTSRKIRKMLLQHGVERYGTNTLHSACDKGDRDAVKRLLELGADVNSALDDGRTPLHIAVFENSSEVVEMLLQRGADFLTKDDKGYTLLSRVFERDFFVSKTNVYGRLMYLVLKQKIELQRRMEKETGITMLHLACFILDVEEVRGQLDRGVKVDAQVHDDSKVWPGCTALHALIIKVIEELPNEEFSDDVDTILELLLMNGADVKVANADENTPVHISFDKTKTHSNQHTVLLLKHHRDFQINPVNPEGVSHFHLAVALNCVEVVEKFLEHGVNVNQPTDFFAGVYNGCTPLHLAVDNANTLPGMRIVDLLLSHGADVNREDVHGMSAFHKARGARLLRLHLMKNLLRYGADINSEDVCGRTPFENLLRSPNATVKDIGFFLHHGCLANVYNPVNSKGYLGIILLQENKECRDMLFEEIIRAPDVTKADELGRTIIHNVAATTDPAISSEEYVCLFNRFKGFGHDVDDQDCKGQTALHVAAMFGNTKAIMALLNIGADFNIVDSKGKSPLSYAVEPCRKCEYDERIEHRHPTAIEALVRQLFKLSVLNLDVSQLNHDLKIITCFKLFGNYTYYDAGYFDPECNAAKNFTIKPLSLTLYHFLSETDAVIDYYRMSELKRDAIDLAFEEIDDNFEKIVPLLKLQYRKAVKRFQLAETASSSLKSLIRIPLPDLCADIILRFLSVIDLKNVVAAANIVPNLVE